MILMKLYAGTASLKNAMVFSRDTEMPATPPAVPARRRPEIEDEDIEEYKNLGSALVAEQKKELTAMERLLKRRDIPSVNEGAVSGYMSKLRIRRESSARSSKIRSSRRRRYLAEREDSCAAQRARSAKLCRSRRCPKVTEREGRC